MLRVWSWELGARSWVPLASSYQRLSAGSANGNANTNTQAARSSTPWLQAPGSRQITTCPVHRSIYLIHPACHSANLLRCSGDDDDREETGETDDASHS